MARVIQFRSQGQTHGRGSSRQSSIDTGYNRPKVSTQVATSYQEGKPFLIGEWLVEPTLNRISMGDVTVQLELKAMDVLLCLVRHDGEVVTKNDLFDSVWETEFASDNTVTTRIAEIRRAFGDDARNPRYIETIHKRGYRLIAEVRAAPTADEVAPPVPEAAPSPEDEHNPYPGLAAFSEADADSFFGRETESEALWRKITARRLLAVIGPSGVGKSSLLRAGVAPRAPPGWRVVVFTPGEAPALSLARALVPDHSGDPAAMARLLGLNDADTALAVVSRWRGQFKEVVLVVDQFEELFTLNPPEEQTSFIELLRRIVDAADVHLVLAMRDDYLYRCQQYEQIAPIFKDLTPLPPPQPEGLRRALKEPAARQLYRFESEMLVDRMIAEVEGERGALPLMAFAVHRLWEERDGEERLLTEEAYERIGGVAGALAKHADATLERIGFNRLPIVRELFRNLVTAEGTRAVREVDELLSVFGQIPVDKPPGRDSADAGRGFIHRQSEAADVLAALIDARLLTGYRDQGDDDQPTRQVEIIHESLLATWPRLVRWQTQDADSARLRDELRQTARVWDDHKRANDYLWTGRAFREFSVWRENYPGGLTDLEEEFAAAMTSLATRKRRRSRMVVAAIIAVLLAVLAVVGTLWQRSVQETRRAEAAKLLALGQLRLVDYPTATLAHAIASLELADTPEVRRLALRALWEGPTAFVINEDGASQAEFAAGGERLVQVTQSLTEGHLRIVTSDGSGIPFERVHDSPMAHGYTNPNGDVAYTTPNVEEGVRQNLMLWSLPDGRKLNETWFDPPTTLWSWVFAWDPNRLLIPVGDEEGPSIYAFNFDGTTERLGTLDLEVRDRFWHGRAAMDRHKGRWFVTMDGTRVVVIEIGEGTLSTPRLLGHHEGDGLRMAFDPEGRLLVTSSSDGRIKIWQPTATAPLLEFEGPALIDHLEISSETSRLEAYSLEDGAVTAWVWSLEDGTARLMRNFDCGPEHNLYSLFLGVGWDPSRRLFAKCGPGESTRLWSLSAPVGADPLVLRRGGSATAFGLSFHPGGSWIATAQIPGLSLWPLSRSYPWVIRTHTSPVETVDFGPDGAWLVSGSDDGIVRLSPLTGEVPGTSSFKYDAGAWIHKLGSSPDGATLLVGAHYVGTWLVPLDGRPPSRLGSLRSVYSVGFSSDGRLAVAAGYGDDSATRIHVYRTDTQEEIAVLEPEETKASIWVDEKRSVLPDGRIMAAVWSSGIWISDPTTGSHEHLFECDGLPGFAVSADGRRIVLVELADGNALGAPSRVLLLDRDTGTTTHLERHGDQVWSVAMNATGTIVATGDREGVLRVGSTSGAEPHLLLGHEGLISDVEIDPLGRWIATGGKDTTVRIWPMPDLSMPPLHTLPHDKLLAKLKSLTNLRMARDAESPTGWTLTHGPFPGWETVPTW